MRFTFLVIFFLFCSLEGKEVHDIIQSIPSKDREKIERLFSHFVQRDSLGYVLFGNTKAVSVASIPIVCNYALVPPSITKTPLRYQRNLKQCWKVWRRYRHRFQHPNIIVCEEYDFFKECAFVNIIFIDKKKLKKLLDKYHQDFAEILGDSFSSEKFITRVEQKKKLRPLLKQDEKLFGLILGFGKESSTVFKKMVLGEKVDPSFGLAGYRPQGCCITPVSFRGNPDSQEVQALVESYTKEISDIEAIFKSDSFLADTLEKFCSP